MLQLMAAYSREHLDIEQMGLSFPLTDQLLQNWLD